MLPQKRIDTSLTNSHQELYILSFTKLKLYTKPSILTLLISKANGKECITLCKVQQIWKSFNGIDVSSAWMQRYNWHQVVQAVVPQDVFIYQGDYTP